MPNPVMLPSFDPSKVLCRDIPRLRRLARAYGEGRSEGDRESYARLLAASAAEWERRRSRAPILQYRDDLPITSHRDAILEALGRHQALIVQGGTGSGKSTQLPKFLFEGGYAAGGLIGLTQPRRIAALSITDRLRQETGLPERIGSKIRFLEDCPPETEIKVMTDGILLQEFRRDPLLHEYAGLILDEAHERSLNIDILLGICRGILPGRPEFRLIIASATLDAKLFSQYLGDAPVVEVEGRQFPVEVQYWETSGTAPARGRGAASQASGKPGEGDDGDDEEKDSEREFTYQEAAAIAIREMERRWPDNLLCFLPTEKDIHELHRELEKDLGREFVILPLYGRLGAGEQKRIYQETSRAKIILATNIAETSLTIPGIAYVVDSGLARISRYHPQTRIQGLPIERISQASARQRAGRAGRVKPGICIRLYSREDFAARPDFTEPEILRSNLANVVLQLKALRLPVEDFPFLTPPARNAFRGAFKQLHELGALSDASPEGRLTRDGRELARLPVDVTLGKILLTAARLGVLQPAMVLAAGLTVQDPRYFPAEEPERQKAQAAHRRFEDPRSDFTVMLNLWNWLQEAWGDGLSQRRLRRLCEENYLGYRRVREWMDLYEQFCRLMKSGFPRRALPREGLDQDAVHKAVAAGFLTFLAQRRPDEPLYTLAAGGQAYLHPRSALAKKRPEWVVASEVKQTSRVFLVRAAEIDPAWVEELAADFCRRSYYDVAWNRERGFVEARERVTFRGLVIRQDRRVNYEGVDPEACAELFWRAGVMAGETRRRFAFLDGNRRVLERLESLERKTRARGLVPDEEALLGFYRSRAPGVVSEQSLERFLEERGDKCLRFEIGDWTSLDAKALDELFPDALSLGVRGGAEGDDDRSGGVVKEVQGEPEDHEAIAPVLYHLDYGSPLDGISVELPIRHLPGLSPRLLFERLPGWRGWMLDYVLERLPKAAREGLEGKRPALLKEWSEIPTWGELSSPALALLAVLKPRLGGLAQPFSLPRTWPAHLQVHLRLFSPETGRRFLVEVPPAMGPAAFFAEACKILYGGASADRFETCARRWRQGLGGVPPVLFRADGEPAFALAPDPLPAHIREAATGPARGEGGQDEADAGWRVFVADDEARFHHALAGLLEQARGSNREGPASTGRPDREELEAAAALLEQRLEKLFAGLGPLPGVTPPGEDQSRRLLFFGRTLLPAQLAKHWAGREGGTEWPEAPPAVGRDSSPTGRPSMGNYLQAALPPLVVEAKAGARMKSLSDLGKLASGADGGKVSVWAELCLGAAWLSWKDFLAAYGMAVRAAAGDAGTAAAAGLSVAAGRELMLRRPFTAAVAAQAVLRQAGATAAAMQAMHAAGDALGTAATASGSGNRMGLDGWWEGFQGREQDFLRALKAARGRVSGRLGALGLKSGDLPDAVRNALQLLDKPGLRPTKAALALVEAEAFLEMEAAAGTALGKPAPSDGAPKDEFKEKLLQDLSQRFRKL